jgi:hypothetical protein
MAIVRGKLANIQTIPSTAGSVYANLIDTKTFIRGFTLFNGNTTAEVVKLYSVPTSSGNLGTASSSNQFMEITLSPLETFVFDFPSDGLVLDSVNDSVQAVTTTANKVTIIFHGVKEV